MNLLIQPDYKPQKPKHLLQILHISSGDSRAFKRLIREMAANGEIIYGQSHFVLPNTVGTGKAEQEKRKRKEKINTTPELNSGRYTSPSSSSFSSSLITGKFQRRPSGIGFVRPKTTEGDEPGTDIFIPAFWTKDAASGDIVAVQIMGKKSKAGHGKNAGSDRSGSKAKRHKPFVDDRGPRGRVVEIIERASNRFVGTYEIENGWGYVRIDGSIYKRTIPLGDASASSARAGDKIVIEMVNYPTAYTDGEAVIVEVLGPHGIPGVDTLLILRQFDLPDHFPENVLREAADQVKKFFKLFPEEDDRSKNSKSGAALTCCLTAAQKKKLKQMNRLDLTDELIITCDPVDAKDFDDAVSLTKLDNGHWELGVHIADVSYFVTKNSAIDKEAVNRATSVYLPDRVIPMLPEVLANAIASLQPDKIRFAQSVFIEFTPDGVRQHTGICRSVVKSKQRFHYAEVQDFFDHPEKYASKWKPEVRQLLHDLHELMKTLRKRRFERGSLEMDIPETKIDLDEDGSVAGAHIYPYYDSNRVIEECMLAANEAVAEVLEGKHFAFLRRIHKGPTVRKLQTFTDFVRSLELADLKAEDLYQDRFAIQRLLNSVRGTPQEYAVNVSLLRSMQKAVYSPDTEGHYALASQCYGHFTSPIRRYPDLTVHRLIAAILDGEGSKSETGEISPSLETVPALTLLGEHCSDREQRAEEAERELIKLKLIGYMSRHIGEPMEAVVTSVEHFGVFVRGVQIPAEGLIRIEGLTDDVYRFEQSAKILMGQREGNTLRIGDRLLIETVCADIDSRQIDFRLVKRKKADKPAVKVKKGTVKKRGH
ncbi:MAG: VacB/RNase II family 3'-5' exoribonuclease [Planctomycetaceae bacterium]|nr:VacB/RNase II family 3'-5' exoribonuclease [Planctomycetaceae bacterium]